jgi:signal transduction histidine kinase
MISKRIERWIAGVRAPLRIKLQLGFFLVIGVPLLTGVVSLLAIAEIREHAHQLVGVVGFVVFSVALALMLGSILASSILHPVRKMDAALERIARGDFVTLDDVVNRDELGSLVNNLNRTSRQLSELYANEHHTAQVLEEQLATLEHTQAQLRQAQKMEAVGRLAGGVAHDFNNLLTVITGRAALLLMDLPGDDPKRRDIDLITQTADRASALTRQLLALSRQQVLQPRILDLNELVESLEPILQRLIGEHIELHVLPAPGAAAVKADPSQIEQVILNLTVNARDAMPRGGTLTIELSQVAAGQPQFDESAPVGPGVSLLVQDSGLGMTPDAQAHMFEPFFTTKAPGKGTGLGLATVYGIIKQSGGHVSVQSKLGHGTTFMIWLPLVENPASLDGPTRESAEPKDGRETILLVEDEEGVRELAREVLQGHGYTVIEARDGESALRIVGDRRERVHLLLTDVLMPKMGGRELVRRLLSRHPDVKVLYMSGYPDGTLGEDGVLEPGAILLQKPFTPQGMVNKVRQVLDGTLTSTNR